MGGRVEPATGAHEEQGLPCSPFAQAAGSTSKGEVVNHSRKVSVGELPNTKVNSKEVGRTFKRIETSGWLTGSIQARRPKRRVYPSKGTE